MEKLKNTIFIVLFILHSSNIKNGWIDATFLQGLRNNKWVVIPSFVQSNLTKKMKIDHKKKFHRYLQTIQLLPMYRCKYIAKADIESRGLHNFCETLLVFEDSEARDRMRNNRDIEILTNTCFSELNHAKGLMSVDQSIKSKTSQEITSENKAVIILDHPGKRSNAFDMQIAEPLFHFCHRLLIPVAINNPQWNCYLCNMVNVQHLMGDTECDYFFRMNMDKD